MSNLVEFIIKLKDLASQAVAQFGTNVSKTFDKANDSARNFERHNKYVGKSIDGISNSIDRLKDKARTLTITKPEDIIRLRTINSEIKKLERLKSKMETMNGSRFGGWIRDAFAQLPGIATNPIVAMGAAGTLAGRKAMTEEGYKSSIGFSTNGHGTEAMDKIDSISNKYGLRRNASMEGFATLSGSLRASGTSLNEQVRIFESVASAARAMNLTAEDSKGVFLALGQMASKGTVSAEELRGQLGERIPGAFSIAAKSIGVTEQELNKLLDTGALAASDFLPKFATEMQKTFAEAGVSAAQNGQAALNRFLNTVDKISVSLGNMILPSVTSALESITNLIENLKKKADEIIPAIGILAGVFFYANAGAIGMSIGFKMAAIATALAESGFIKLTLAMLKNPFTWIAIAIYGVIKGVQYLWDKFEGFRKFFYSLWETIKQIFNNIKGLFGAVFSPIADAIAAIQDGRWADAGKAFLALNPVSTMSRTIEYVANGGLTQGVVDSWQRGQALGAASWANSHGGTATPGAVPVAPNFLQNIANGTKSANNKPLVVTDKWQGNSKVDYGLGGASQSTNNSAKSIGEGVTHSGPRSIVVNITKEMVGAINLHSVNVKEGIGEIEQMVTEMIRRTIYSLETAN